MQFHLFTDCRNAQGGQMGNNNALWPRGGCSMTQKMLNGPRTQAALQCSRENVQQRQHLTLLTPSDRPSILPTVRPTVRTTGCTNYVLLRLHNTFPHITKVLHHLLLYNIGSQHYASKQNGNCAHPLCICILQDVSPFSP